MKHILLVDDVSTNLKCEGMILQDIYKVTMLKSGEEAIEYLKTTIPDLMILDIRMKNMDGYEVMEHMNGNPATANIPVMLLTADYKQESRARGIALGAIDFITKPVDPQTLLDRVAAVWETEE